MTSTTCSIRDRASGPILPSTALLATLAALACAAAVGCAGERGLLAEGAWSRPASAGASGAVYLSLHNGTSAADRLVGASSAICDTVELHRTEVVDDRMTMRHLAGGLPLGAGERVEFAPGGLHVMLFGLRQPLAVGSRFTLTLEFEHGGNIPLDVEVRR